MKQRSVFILFSLLLCVTATLSIQGCAAFDPYRHDEELSQLPPILAQDEVIRPYVKLGRIQVTRDVYQTDGSVSADIRAWGFNAIRREARKMGADAVIFPEVTGSHSLGTILPSTEYRATGIAIKFK